MWLFVVYLLQEGLAYGPGEFWTQTLNPNLDHSLSQLYDFFVSYI